MIINILIVCVIALVSSAIHIMLKRAACDIGPLCFNGQDMLTLIIKGATNPYMLGGLVIMGLNTLAWVVMLGRVNLSVAHPLLSFSYVFSVLAGILFFGETLTCIQTAGIMCIMLGSVLLAYHP